MDKKISGFAQDLGLEYISRYDSPSQSLLAQREAQFTGEPVAQRVDALFNTPSLDQTLRHFIAPHPRDPAILTPARFEALVRDSAKELRALAAAEKHPVLQHAADLLDHELQLRELLANYRDLLMRA